MNLIRQFLTLILAFAGGFLVVGGWIWAPNISSAMSSFVSVGPSVSLFADANRLGRPEVALEILLRDGPNNRYLPNGHCPQRSDEAAVKDPSPTARKREIAFYLPANGALLSAVALMVAGWDGSAAKYPGFPKDGSWTIRAEGLRPLP